MAVTIAKLPISLIIDVLQAYSSNHERLKNLNRYDKGTMMRSIAENWPEDVSYEGFDLVNLTGPLLTKILCVERKEYRKIFALRSRGSGYAAAKANHHCWEEAFAAFSKEDEFDPTVVQESSMPPSFAEPIMVPLPHPDTLGSIDSMAELLFSSATNSPTPRAVNYELSPSCRKRDDDLDTRSKKQKLEHSQLRAHDAVIQMAANHIELTRTITEHMSISTRLKQRQLELLERQAANQ
eukprot:NODE_190_length_13461_cov_0.525595.p8 type:complete len:238 gc:universal NODE_190_length_13461_cov_0.525595:3676-4389(+)